MNVSLSQPEVVSIPEKRIERLGLWHWIWPAIALLAFWWTLIDQLRVEWSTYTQYRFGWAVPAMMLYLLWQRWTVKPNPEAASSRAILLMFLSVLLIAVSFVPVRLVQEANPDWRLISWAMAIQVLGLTLAAAYVAGGLPWLRHFAFPLLFFFVAVPWPTWAETHLIQGLTRANTAVTLEGLTWLGIPALQQGNVIQINSGMVGIDEACSGIRSFQATLMVSLFLGEFYRLRWGPRVALLVGGVLLAFACNVGRTFLLVHVASTDGISAIDKWHDPAGISILLICLFGLWALALWFKNSALKKSEIQNPNSKTPTSTSHLPFRLWSRGPWSVVLPPPLLACFLFTEIGTRAWYASHERQLPKATEWSLAWPVERATFKWLEVPERARQILRFNDGRSGAWTDPDGTRWQAFFFRWNPGRTASTLARTHTPEICLPAAGKVITSSTVPELFQAGTLALPFRRFSYESKGRPIHVFYRLWEDRALEQKVEADSLTYANRLQQVLEGRRNVGQRVVHLAIAGVPDAKAAEALLHARLPELIRLSRDH